MSARWFTYETREDECAEPDWYECEHIYAMFAGRSPRAYAGSDGTIRYSGRIDAEMFRLLLAAIAAPTEADVRGLK